LRLLVMMRNG
jgi:hypothetical protein